MRKNVAPIFVNGFERSGTNILVNLLTSHPDVAAVEGETNEVFQGKWNEPIRKWSRRLRSAPILLASKQKYFDSDNLEARPPLPEWARGHVDSILHKSKMRHELAGLRPEGRLKDAELAKTRTLSKNLNGVVLTTPELAEIFPDARFVCLVREGRALMNGFLRRGWQADKFSHLYHTICSAMLDFQQQLGDRVIMLQYEKMVADPLNTIAELAQGLGLSQDGFDMIRLQNKKVKTTDGKYDYVFGGGVDREVHWFPKSEIPQYLVTTSNQAQAAETNSADALVFEKTCAQLMSELGY